MTNYSTLGPSVSIYVEYRLVPGATAPVPAQIGWAAAVHARVSVTELDVFHSGAFLDASNTAWAVLADCKVNGVVAVAKIRCGRRPR